MLLFPTCVYAESDNPVVHAEVVNLPDTDTITANTSNNTVDVGSGLPAVSGDQLSSKVNNMATSIHQLAMKVSPQLAIVVLVGCALLGIFIEAARRMIIFIAIGLAVIYWAPMLVSLWIGFLQ